MKRKLLFYALGLISSVIIAQVDNSQFKRVVECTEEHFTRYSIPQGVSLESLTNMDIIEAIPYTSKIKTRIEVDNFNRLKTEKYYLSGMSGISKYDGISRSISTSSGTRIFDSNNIDITSESEPSIDNLPMLSNEMISRIGLDPSIIAPTSEQIQSLSTQGIGYYTSDNNKFYIVHGDVNILNDIINNSQETRVFKAGRLHVSESKNMLEIAPGKSIITKQIIKSYKTLPSGLLLEIQDLVLFSDYKIYEQGNLIYEQPTSNQNNLSNQISKTNSISTFEAIQPIIRELQVKHTSQEFIKVELPNLRDGEPELILMSIEGKAVKTFKDLNSNNIEFDMDGLPSGIYLLHYTDKLGRLSKQIINY